MSTSKVVDPELIYKLRKEKIGNGYASFYIVYPNGSIVRHIQQGCHWALKDLGNSRGASYVLTYLQKGGKPKTVSSYLDWLTTESVWADCFITKGGKEILELGVFAVDCDQPSNLMVGALIATRMIWEYPLIIERIIQFKDKYNLDGDIAFILGQLFRIDADSLVLASISSSHVPLDLGQQTSLPYVQNFLRHKTLVRNPPYSISGTYSNVFATFGDNSTTRTFFQYLIKFFPGEIKRVGEVVFGMKIPGIKIFIKADDFMKIFKEKVLPTLKEK